MVGENIQQTSGRVEELRQLQPSQKPYHSVVPFAQRIYVVLLIPEVANVLLHHYGSDLLLNLLRAQMSEGFELLDFTDDLSFSGYQRAEQSRVLRTPHESALDDSGATASEYFAHLSSFNCQCGISIGIL